MRRWRKTVLWVGCMSCVLIAVAFVVSGLVDVSVGVPEGLSLTVSNGAVFLLPYAYAGLDVPFAGWNSSWDFSQSNRWSAGPYVFAVPLYAVFLAVALPTLLVWRFVPKFPPGHCRRCGYNLTGLTEPRCPECGQPFEAKGDAP